MNSLQRNRATVRCWTCVGNGKIPTPIIGGKGAWPTTTCPDCNGTSIDKAKTEKYQRGNLY